MWVETFVTGFVMIPLFTVVPSSDYDNAFSASASFWSLLLIPSGGLDRFSLLYAHFASITTLCNSLRGLSYLFDHFLTFCSYFRTVVICFAFVVGKSTTFSFLRLSTLSSIRIRSEKYLPMYPFSYLIKKNKYLLSISKVIWHIICA